MDFPDDWNYEFIDPDPPPPRRSVPTQPLVLKSPNYQDDEYFASTLKPSTSRRKDTGKLLDDLKEANARSDIKQIGARQLDLLERYREKVLNQASESFRWALISTGVGLVFFLAAIVFLLFFQSASHLSLISLISGGLVEFIAGVNFVLYGRASTQFTKFSTYLDRVERYVFAENMCDRIENSVMRDELRADIIRDIIAGGTDLISQKLPKSK